MTNSYDTTLKHVKHLNIAWALICAFLLIFIAMLISNYVKLRNELEELRAKPVHITYLQKHNIIKEYLAVSENKWALRQNIGCKEE